MVCSCPLGALDFGFPRWCWPRSASTCVLLRATLPELQSNLCWLLPLVGLEISGESQALNLGWLLLVSGLGLTEASCCLFDRIYKVLKHSQLMNSDMSPDCQP